MILMANYKIGELSKLLKIPETTIRYYDKMGIIDSQKNEENGYRLFNDVDMHNLMHYKMYRSYGLSQKAAQQCIYDFELSEIDQTLMKNLTNIDLLIHFVKVVLRNFPAIVHNEPLDFIAHSFLAGGAEVDFHPIGRVSDFLHNIGLFCFLYGQRGSVCGGAGFIAHRLSFP